MMTNKLEQMLNDMDEHNCDADNEVMAFGTSELEVIYKALTLLKEVEEGKAHVMRWVNVKDDDCFERENVLVSSVWEDASVCCGVNGDDDFFYATFNNNNGEIPIPKEGE